MSKSTTRQDVPGLKAELLRLGSQERQARRHARAWIARSLARAWEIGKTLRAIKASVGAPHFELWLKENLAAGFGNAALCLELATANPLVNKVEELSEKSVRKFHQGYVPAKVRPVIKGDAPIRPLGHHLRLATELSKYKRQVELGHAELNKEEARHDLAQLREFLERDVYGDNSALQSGVGAKNGGVGDCAPAGTARHGAPTRALPRLRTPPG
ncbi:MAG TPA: hypothetical protein VGO11_19755 [Chthoniobacteraceae bacterium]|jgi:hypothetical protein|nr:hypothetical protein [Chthoniobacteraceae bacterium]